MVYADRETLERLRNEYPRGSRVVIEKMDDPQAPPPGTMGTVTGVDDAGSILVSWDNGSGLNVVYGEDRVRKMIMTDKVFRQLLAIRDTGLTNMFDSDAVQRLAYDRGFYELVMYIEEHRGQYARFILTGRED